MEKGQEVAGGGAGNSNSARKLRPRSSTPACFRACCRPNPVHLVAHPLFWTTAVRLQVAKRATVNRGLITKQSAKARAERIGALYLEALLT